QPSWPASVPAIREAVCRDRWPAQGPAMTKAGESVSSAVGIKRRYNKMHAEHADSDRLNDLSGRVIGCAFTVLNMLGAGFPEKVHENALAHEMRAASLAVVQRCGVGVYCRDVAVGEYFADPLAEHALLVALKTVRALDDAHRLQCGNYLKASGLRLSFGQPRLAIERVVNGL
ncbi:MAG: GxxExxY protein, partial [Acetobacteraceae bacterium]|nr:GxxExxY protein [Acetobacteraceae bacterium]